MLINTIIKFSVIMKNNANYVNNTYFKLTAKLVYNRYLGLL